MMRCDIKNDNMRLTEKQQKYQHYHLKKLINMNILQMKEGPRSKKSDRRSYVYIFSSW